MRSKEILKGKELHEICSADFPLSTFFMLVQALMNNLISDGLSMNDGELYEVIGDWSAKEILSMIAERFNMDGFDTSGQRVGLLNHHHLWAHIVDPFHHQFCNKIDIPTDMTLPVGEMIAHYIRLHHEGSSTTCRQTQYLQTTYSIVLDNLFIFYFSYPTGQMDAHFYLTFACSQSMKHSLLSVASSWQLLMLQVCAKW